MRYLFALPPWQRHGLFWLAMTAYFLLPQLIYPDYVNTVGHYFFGFDYRSSPGFLAILFGYTLGIGMLYAYGFLCWVLPPLLTGRYGAGASRYVGLTVIICYLFRLLKALHVAWLDPWLRHQPFRPIDSRHFDDLVVNQVYIYEYSTIILFIALYAFFTNWQLKQRQANELIQRKLQAQIQLLKARLQPEFMVNSLDYLQRLLVGQPTQAPALVLHLSAFLSYVLYESQADRVPLAHDLAAMQHYLALEKARLGKQLDLSIHLPSQTSGQQVVPLLWLGLLEHALWWSLTSTDQAWLSVTGTLLNPCSQPYPTVGTRLKLSLAASSEIDPLGNERTASLLEQTRQQLTILYADRYTLRLDAEPGLLLLVVTVPLDLLLASVEHPTLVTK